MILLLIIAFASLIALMIIHEFGHFIIAKKFGVKVEEFGIGYPPRLFGKKFGETLYSVNLIPLGAFVKIYGEEGGVDDLRSFANLAIWKRILIVLGGVLAFWIASIIIFSGVFMIGADVPVGDQDIAGFSNTKIQVTAIAPNSPAETGGLKKGDTIIELQTASEVVRLVKIADFQNFTQEYKGTPIILIVHRDGKDIALGATPRTQHPENEGPLGVSLERMVTVVEKAAWYEAPIKGAVFTWDVTVKAVQGIFDVFANLFSGKGVPKGAELAGPIGITIFLARAADYGVGFFLYFIGSISVFIALFNIFPIPALDGGKLLFLLIEKVIKRPVSVKLEQTLTVTCFFLLIAMSIFVTIKFDIPRLTEFWKAGL
ncbi:MAG: M50 family metallopeptidase [bacterium]|nr:M50 family metallopeptidase [bacterium]